MGDRATRIGWRWGLLLVLILACVLRLYRLDAQGLWYNEAIAVAESEQPLGKMLTDVLRYETTPPLYFLLLHGCLEVFGIGDIQARILSAVFGILTVPLTYLLGCHLFDRRTGLLAACLVTLSQLAVQYSQEARCYSQLIFLSTCSSYLFILALHKHSAWAWWGFISALVLMLYTHYYGIFILGALLVYAWLYRQRYPLPRTWLAAGLVLVVGLLTPWVATGMLVQSQLGKQCVLHEQPPWFRVHPTVLFRDLNQFNNGEWKGPFGGHVWWCIVTGGLLFTVPAVFAVGTALTGSRFLDATAKSRTFKEGVVFVAILWLLPTLLILSLSAALKVQYQVRYIIFCITPYYLLVAYGLCQLNAPLLRRGLITLVLLYSTLALQATYFLAYKENYRDALAYLAKEYQEGDFCLFLPVQELPIQWSIYHEHGPDLRLAQREDITARRTDDSRIWSISFRQGTWNAEESDGLERLLDGTHARVLEKHYCWVNLHLYVPKPSGS
jgi:4-amino-4-deoxy-L-arabinose transferase-like glycosyltransferase